MAPDGIAIHAFAAPTGAHVGVVEGRIPPGVYGVHRHLSLEQYTYVIAGRVVAITGDDATPTGQRTVLHAGDLILTLPGESLQFVNDSEATARVLFICAPPYPADDADTLLHASHGPMTAAERAAAIERLEAARAAFDQMVAARIAHLRAPPPT